MVKRLGSKNRKTRQKLSKNIHTKSKIRISTYLQSFKSGDRVALKVEPAIQKGQYYLRFHGKTGQVTGSQGECYKVKIRDFNKQKTLLVHPIHLKRIQ